MKPGDVALTPVTFVCPDCLEEIPFPEEEFKCECGKWAWNEKIVNFVFRGGNDGV